MNDELHDEKMTKTKLPVEYIHDHTAAALRERKSEILLV